MEYLTIVILAVTNASRMRSSGEADTIFLRLNGGIPPNQGRVEVMRMRNNADYEQWGSLCGNGFGATEALVVCRQLGYRHSRVENGVYKAMFQADYVLDGVICNGMENTISNCTHNKWGTHNCYATSNAHAGVCCSNSSDFGEYKDDLFISHCAKSWTGAELMCERHSGTLSSPDLGSARHRLRDELWTSRFFTPWIWANGCYRLQSDMRDREHNISHNSPGACFQYCQNGFGLSGRRCVCLGEVQGSMTEVEAAHCDTPCPGTDGDLCGHPSSYHSVYAVEAAWTSDIFQHYTPPRSRRQCAVLVKSSWKTQLHTRPCDSFNGYICSRLGMKPLVLDGDTEKNTTMPSARQQCRDADESMRLAGQEILSTNFRVHGQVSLWIDLSRAQFDGVIQWEIDNGTRLQPEWCISARTVEGQIQYDIVKCQQRLGFICQTRPQSTPGKVLARTTTRGTGNEPKTTIVNVQTTQTTDFEKHVAFHVSLIIGSTLLAMVLLLLLFCWCCRTGKKTDRANLMAFHRNSIPTNNSTVSEILTAEQPVYAEVFMNTENTYDVLQDAYAVIPNDDLQLQSMLNANTMQTDNETDMNNTAACDSDVRVYYEYSNPIDNVTEDDAACVNITVDDENKYIYPFDAIIRHVSH